MELSEPNRYGAESKTAPDVSQSYFNESGCVAKVAKKSGIYLV